MAENDGLGFWIWGGAEVVNVSIGAEAEDDGGSRWSINGLALGADGDFAVVADADAGWLAPDVGPPRAIGGGTDRGALFGEGLLLSSLGCLAEFAVDFVLVGVGHELVEEGVGPDQCNDLFGGQEGDEAFLPVVVAAFDFAFGLGRWGLAELVEAACADAQFERDGFGGEPARAGLGEEVADQWRGNTVCEWEFFMARKLTERWI